MLGVLGKNKVVRRIRKIKFPTHKNVLGLKFSIGMGCICSKGTKDENKVKKEKNPKKSKRLAASSSKDETEVDNENGVNEVTTRLISPENAQKSGSSTPTTWDKKPVVFEKPEVSSMQKPAAIEQPGQQSGGEPQICRVLSVRNGVDGAQVVAGWPSWLTSVAGEAIKGWVPRKADSFEKLDKIGQGTYSSVYRARDLETGKIVALKKVRFATMDPESVRFMAREILILRRLDHPNVMKLQGLVTSRVSGNLYLVFEYMEHDLSGLLASPAVKFTESQIKCFMQQLFRGLEHCHSRGVLHRDIKGSNLLIDNNGNLKIADFGLATFYLANQKQPLTSRVVTLWYRPPELLLGATDYGVSVDLWSSGCILAELFAGKPIMPGRTEVEQLHKIFKLCGSPSEEYWKKSKLPHATIFKPQQPYKRLVAETFKDFPSSALELLETLLAFEPKRRGTTVSALQSEFFSTNPLPCDPSSLPKYPPSKEYDVKGRDEDARRQRAANGVESSKKGSKESRAVPAPEANAELQSSILKQKGKSNPKSSSEKYNPEEDAGSGFPMENPSRATGNSLDVVDQGGLNRRPLDSSSGYRELNAQRSFKPQSTAASRLSRFSNSVAARGSSNLDCSRDSSVHSQWSGPYANSNRYEQVKDAEATNHLLEGPDFHYNNSNGQVPSKEKPKVGALKKTRMHYSGPLLLPGGNVEEMLKEHEKQIQIAVRKAREKSKAKKGHESDALLENVNNGR